MKHNNYCSRCKKKDVGLVKYAKNTHTQYYMCHTCNNTRVKNYRRTKAGSVATLRTNQNSIARFPEKQAARVLLNSAVYAGKVRKPTICSRCQKSGRIEGHHSDYTKPLEVTWVCTLCHTIYHPR